MDMFSVIYLFEELDNDELIRIELINGNKIYFLPSDDYCVEPDRIETIKQIKENKWQQIIIDANSIAVVCTMSRETYDLKLSRGELYV